MAIEGGIKMELKELEYLIAIAEEKSISKAAERLFKMCIRDRKKTFYRRISLPAVCLSWSEDGFHLPQDQIPLQI